MTKIYKQRMTSHLDGEFVIFLIGLRINKLWKVHKWLTVFLAMPRFGLSKIGKYIPAEEKLKTARGRMAG